VPYKGTYKVVFNTDDAEFGGSGVSAKSYKAEKEPMHGFDQSISMTLAPLSVMYLKTSTRKKNTKPAEETVKTSPRKTGKVGRPRKKTPAVSEK
ncbi:MAG: alpha amylase C-terminal domain-containing protein, partial [Ruminococcus sp.]|nr:alpha amylase C-terminal domain-containing protein [Ruminococcus sp.]